MTPAEYKRKLKATSVEIARYRDMLDDLLDKVDDLLDKADDLLQSDDMRDGTAIGRAVHHLNAAYAAVEKAEQ